MRSLVSRRLTFAAALTAAAAAVPVALAAEQGRLFFEDTLAPRGSASVTVTVRRPAAFRIVLRTPTAGRTRLYLLGRRAPKGGPLIDTRTTRCEGAAGSFYCRGSYEALPAGTYTFKIQRTGAMNAHVELTVRW